MIDLTTPCGVNATVHTCMDPFKENPVIVRNWRALWRSLPAYLRQEALLKNAAKDVACTALMALGNGLVKYSFLGQPVCRNAFMTLTGIGAWSLTEARKKAESGHKSCLSQRELGRAMLLQNTSQPKHYLDARSWLVHYADTHADKSPISLECYLPAGRKSFYHSAYVHDRKANNLPFASLPVFLAAWRCECPWLVVMKSVSKFVKCNLCEYLKMQIDQTPRSEVQVMEILRDRSTSSCWGPHISVLSAIKDHSCHPVDLRPSVVSSMHIISKLLLAINDRSGMLVINDRSSMLAINDRSCWRSMIALAFRVVPLNLNWMPSTLGRLFDYSSNILSNPIMMAMRTGLGNTMHSKQLNAWRKAS